MTTADPFRIRSLSDADVARMDGADLHDDERRCLGAAILDNVCLDGPLAGLSSQHFTWPAHQELFTLMREWRDAGLRFDLERLRQALLQKKRLQAIGDFAYLQQLVHHGRQSLGNVSGNARLLMRKAAASNKLQATSQNQEKAVASESNKQQPTTTRPAVDSELKTENFVVTLAEVEAKPVDWIWEPYLPCGAVAVLSGDPGVGKSFVALAIAARFTAVASGQWPVASKSNPQPEAASDKQETPQSPTENRELRTENSSCSVLYVGGSDNAAQIMRPRFDALGGDAKRLYLLQESRFPLPVARSPQDKGAEVNNQQQASGRRETGNGKLIPFLATALRQTRARLVILDPLESYLAAENLGPRSQKFRRWLDQLACLAVEYHCCVLLVRTLSRSPSGRATASALGSLELTGAVRSHLVAGVSADYPEERALIHVKSNWGPCGSALGYTIDEAGTFCWTGASTLTLEDIFAATPNDEQKTALAEAEDFLQIALRRGAERAATVQQDAHNLGIATITLRRAKRRLGVMAKKRGLGPWEWEKPVGSGSNQEAAFGSGPSAVGQQPATSNQLQATGVNQETQSSVPSPAESRGQITNPWSETPERQAYQRSVVRGGLIFDYLKRTGQLEPFKIPSGIDFKRLHDHFGPLYDLAEQIDEMGKGSGQWPVGKSSGQWPVASGQ